MKTKKNPSAEVIFAESETDANLYYATQFLVPDPVFYFKIRSKKYLMLNDLEIDRGRKQAQVDQVLSLSECQSRTAKKIKRAPSMAEIAVEFLKDQKISQLIVPHHFPAYLAHQFQLKKLKITFREDPFCSERLLKTKTEKEAIRESLKHTGNAIRHAYTVLKNASIQKSYITYQNKTLTSEKLKQIIDIYLLEHECLARDTIVAGGNQAVDPHDRGSGKLKAHQSIVMDVFPKSIKTQYYADMSRTVVKGKASAELKKMWHTVKQAQETAIEMVREGINAQKIHEWICNFFDSKGYKTGVQKGRMQGFFHGTGHGLGLNIHEAPRVSKASVILKEGMVITVEPGLYYEGIGGVRIEDVVYVTKKGCEVLSSCPKILEIA
ncbi:MAG: M24 family metallopeptidase [Deltaproteobacteria bacterium]|nr:M24 family metallopeptidase [Deltaproteobacteria bacterium]